VHASCEVIIERQALLTALTADGPVQRLMDPDSLVMAPARRGICVWTAVLAADFAVSGRWNRVIAVSLSQVISLLSKRSAPAVCLTFAGRTLSVDHTMISVKKSELWRSIATGTAKRLRPARQQELFAFGTRDKLHACGPQLPARGLPLFS